MLTPEAMGWLRCPLDGTTRLTEAAGGLECERCRVVYPVRDGLPCLIPEEAALPDGVERVDRLPCQKK